MFTIPGRIPIRIHPFFWLLIIIIGWINSSTVIGTAIWAIVIFYSVLVHEYGHAFTALAFGQEAEIELVGLGGLTHRKGKKLKLWQDFLITINGPLAGLMLFFAAYLILANFGDHITNPLVKSMLTITEYANLFWTIINLFPIYPLDGGRLFSIIFETLFGIRGVKFALLFSALFGLAVSILFFYIQAILAGALFLMLAFESYRAWQSSLSVSEKDQDDNLQKLIKEADEDIKNDRKEDAEKKLEHIRQSTESGILYQISTEYLANLMTQQGRFTEAYNLLLSLKKNISSNGLRLLQQVAYRCGELKDAVTYGDKAYQKQPGYDIALTNAMCYALLGEAQPAVGWLQRAISDGLPNFQTILKKQEFDSIRKSPAFQMLVQKPIDLSH